VSAAPSTLATLAAFLAVAIAYQLYRAYRPEASFSERWAGERGLELTRESRPAVDRYLRRARLFRVWGGTAGAVLPSLIEYAVDGRVQVLGFGTDGTSAPLAFGSIFVGYLAGALLAEVTLVRRSRGARRVASLARRELADYLPRWAIIAQRTAAVAASVGTLALAAVPFPATTSNPSSGELIAIATLVLAFAAGLEAVERWIVRRPQPFADPALVAADDALRAQSIRAAAGAGLALVLLCSAGISLALQASDVAALQTVMLVPAAVCLIGSLLAYSVITTGAWRVRRRLERPAGATDGAVSA
jgi:hypothetical protein